jgi:tetratricopeptide (TPR) repeat protein
MANRWLTFIRIPLALIAIVACLLAYNRFLLNTKLQNLKASLMVLDKAAGVGQAEAALLLVDQTLVAEMAREEMDLKSLAVLQYAQGSLSSVELERPVEDAQVLVSSLAEDEAIARPAFLATLDSLASGFQSVLNKAAVLPRQFGAQPASQKIDPAMLEQAMQMERLGLYQEAETLYQKLLDLNPNYAGRAILKMRLGYTYQKNQQFEKAENLFRQAVNEARAPEERGVAQQMLGKLLDAKKAEWDAKDVEEKLAAARAGPDRQKLAFQLGSLLIQLYEMKKAARAFREAYTADPSGELGAAALFKEGWCLKMSGQLEESLKTFQEIIQKDPKGRWATISYQQIAESYRATGDYESAARTYEKTLNQSEDAAYSAVIHAFAGSIYLYDLKKPEQAKSHFQKLKKAFPASTFSGMEQQILQTRAQKGLAPLVTGGILPGTGPEAGATFEEPATMSLEAGTPVMTWLEKFLPIFVDVFADRLSRYMVATGTPQLTRRFSELEFKELIVERAQERFADQVQNIDVKIKPEGFVGSGKIRIGILSFDLQATIGITLVDNKPHALVQSIKVGSLSVPQVLCKLLEERTNLAIDQRKYPLRIKQYELKEGYVLISVELVQSDPNSRAREGAAPLFRDTQQQ